MTGFDQSDRERLRRLAERIGKVQNAAKPQEPPAQDPEAARASRMGYELIGAVLACTGIGYLVDEQTGSLPVGTLTGLFLGFVAGVANAWRATSGAGRAAGSGQAETRQPEAAETEKKEGR